jgi:macrolide-specific efflux system membrane fusion protein
MGFGVSHTVLGNRLGKTAILLVVAGVVGATGYLAGHGAAAPQPVVEKLPEVDLSPHVIKARTGTVVSRLVLDATIAAEPAVPVRPEKSGVVTKVYFKAGQYVNDGEAVLEFRYTPEPVVPTNPKAKPKAPKPQTLYLRATVSGKVADLAAHLGSQVTPEADAFAVDRGRFRAVAKVDAKNVYKLYNKPKSIKMKIDHGPAPFACPLIDYGAGVGSKAQSGKDGQNPANGGESAGGGSDVEVTCRIPGHRKVFAGLPGKMSILTAQASRVVVVPLSAVLGQAADGAVTVVGKDGKRELRHVRLGLNDGSQVEIKEGLEAGEQILDRAPEDPAFAGPGQGGDEGGTPNRVILDGGGKILVPAPEPS